MTNAKHYLEDLTNPLKKKKERGGKVKHIISMFHKVAREQIHYTKG